MTTTYFKPWRRKIGIVTLVAACVLMVGWVRSRFVADLVSYRTTSHKSEARSIDGTLQFRESHQLVESTIHVGRHGWMWRSIDWTIHDDDLTLIEGTVTWKWSAGRLELGSKHMENIGWLNSYVIIPYWSLLSVWMLLSKVWKN